MKKKNRDELRQIMGKHRLNSQHVADIIYTTSSTIRTYCSKTGHDISDANLELLKYKIGEISGVCIY